MATMRPFGFIGGDPFRELRRMQLEMERLANAFVPTSGLAAAAFPSVNVFAGRYGIAVTAELPGVNPADLEVHAQHDTLTIAGKRQLAGEAKPTFHRRERRTGAFSRTIQLPFRVDPSRVEARLENGLLRLSLQRPDEDKPRRIDVAAG